MLPNSTRSKCKSTVGRGVLILQNTNSYPEQQFSAPESALQFLGMWISGHLLFLHSDIHRDGFTIFAMVRPLLVLTSKIAYLCTPFKIYQCRE